LTFFGKKTVPAITRVEIARPPPPGVELDRKQRKRLKKDPIIILKAGTRRDLWQPLATVKFARAELAEVAFRKLRDLRLLRDYTWKRLELPAPNNKAHRKRWLQDQLGSSVVDLSTTIDLLNRHLVQTRDTVLKDWEKMQLLAETALNGGLDRLNSVIKIAGETVNSEELSTVTKRTAAETILDKQAERYKMLRALKVVDLVRRETGPEALATALAAEINKEETLTGQLKKTERRLEMLRHREQELGAPDSDQQYLRKVETERMVYDIQENIRESHTGLSDCRKRQQSILESLEASAATNPSLDPQAVAKEPKAIVAQDLVLPEALQSLVQNVLKLKLGDEMTTLNFDGILKDYGVTVYWEDPKYRKYAEDWPQNTLHKPMGLRPFHMRFIASLPSEIEGMLESFGINEKFEGSEHIDDDIVFMDRSAREVVET
jgi:hypothetical protein